ncbi:hypothetical protein AX17_004607 [Amanita inopinata Kibby_2008]|nr:hypothetical protein AX17_004607 [Amanita inopinata Kibby_2008]
MFFRPAFVAAPLLSQQRFRTVQASAISFLRYSESHIMAESSNASLPHVKPLSYGDGPLVWVDCEMTGLDLRRDRLLEIAVVITNGNLDRVDEGLNFVIHTDRQVLDNMNDWCKNQHGKSGLTQACLDSPHTLEQVSTQVLYYIKKWIPERNIAQLAGNSVHVDRTFLAQEMPQVVDWLHYRIVDVSSIKELVRRWYPTQVAPKSTESSHRALDDILGSINELKWYKQNVFRHSPIRNVERRLG